MATKFKDRIIEYSEPISSPSIPPNRSPPMSRNTNLSSAKLTVEASDPAAPLEVKDNKGIILKPDYENNILDKKRIIEFLNLPFGVYRITLISPEGSIVEQLVNLGPREKDVKVTIQPSKPSQDLVNLGNFDVSGDNALHVSEEMGPIINAKLSTVLTLAGRINNYQDNMKTYDKINNLGLDYMTKFTQDTNCGLQILFGWESESYNEALRYLSEIIIHIWPENSYGSPFDSRLKLSTKGIGLAEFSTDDLTPNPHWLSIKIPQQKKPIVFYLAVLPRRITMLVFHMDIDHQLNVFQYFPSVDMMEDQSTEEQFPRKYVSYRRLEFLERFYLSGRLDHADHYSKELLKYKFKDPIAGCLGGYLKLRLGKPHELEIPVDNMTTYFPQLSDSYILRAEYMASLQRDMEAKENIKQALIRGFPVCADGLLRLQDGVKKYEIHDRRVDLLDKIVEHRIRGLLWSAWIPDTSEF